MDTFIKLEVKYLLNEDMADNKFVTLVSIFYDYFDNNILVKSTRKNLEFVVYEKAEQVITTYFDGFHLTIFV